MENRAQGGLVELGWLRNSVIYYLCAEKYRCVILSSVTNMYLFNVKLLRKINP